MSRGLFAFMVTDHPGILACDVGASSFEYTRHYMPEYLMDQGLRVRRPHVLRAWMAAYAGATGSTVSYERIGRAASDSGDPQPSKNTTAGFRDVLNELWLLDAVPSWLPSGHDFSRLNSAPRHFLADPALSARLLGLDEAKLLRRNDRCSGPRKMAPCWAGCSNTSSY